MHAPRHIASEQGSTDARPPPLPKHPMVRAAPRHAGPGSLPACPRAGRSPDAGSPGASSPAIRGGCTNSTGAPRPPTRSLLAGSRHAAGASACSGVHGTALNIISNPAGAVDASTRPGAAQLAPGGHPTLPPAGSRGTAAALHAQRRAAGSPVAPADRLPSWRHTADAIEQRRPDGRR